jgi:hypothetical protein
MNLGKNEITTPHHNKGLDDESSSSRRGSFFLDISFYRTGFSVTGPASGKLACPRFAGTLVADPNSEWP